MEKDIIKSINGITGTVDAMIEEANKSRVLTIVLQCMNVPKGLMLPGAARELDEGKNKSPKTLREERERLEKATLTGSRGGETPQSSRAPAQLLAAVVVAVRRRRA